MSNDNAQFSRQLTIEWSRDISSLRTITSHSRTVVVSVERQDENRNKKLEIPGKNVQSSEQDNERSPRSDTWATKPEQTIATCSSAENESE